MSTTRTRRKIWKWATPVAVLVLIAAGIALFQWNWLRGPIGSAVQDRTGRPFVIAGNLDVGLLRGLEVRVRLAIVLPAVTPKGSTTPGGAASDPPQATAIV